MEANVLSRKGKYAEASLLADSALTVAQNAKDSVSITLSYLLLGNLQCYTGKYAKGMDFYFKGLAIEEQLKKQKYSYWFYSNIGNLYLDQRNYPKALEFSYKAAAAEQKANDQSALLNSLTNLGQIYAAMEKNDSALVYYNRALIIAEKLNDPFGISSSLVNLTQLYVRLKDFEKAMSLGLRSYNVTKKNGFTDLYAYALMNLGCIKKELKQYKEAEPYFLESSAVAKRTGATAMLRESYAQLAGLYEEMEDFKKAFDYFKLHSDTKDSLLNKENSKLITEMNTKYTTEKKEKEIELLKKNEDIQHLELSKKKNELENQRTISIGIFVGFFLLMIVAILMFNRYKLKKKANDELQDAFNLIEEKNTLIEKSNVMITDSIVYAKRIQDAILPATEDLSKALSENFFVFYKPTQIVSGDFYWCSSQNDKTVFIVADCTGHGVPGAFMSMIGNTLLNEIVNELKITCPKKIAELWDAKIIQALHQHSDSNQYDGMDLSICSIDRTKKEIHFTGARHHMYTYNGHLEKIKGDPFSIGGAQQQGSKIYTSQKIEYTENLKLYFLTDGYCDQSGGPSNKRFGTKEFEKLLSGIHELSMDEQLQKLEQTFEDWKGQAKQRDDVLVVGIHC